MNIEERFLKYISYNTQCDEHSSTVPSTSNQLVFARELVKEMKELNISNVELSKEGVIYGTIKGNGGKQDIIGFIAHMDTSPDASGENIKPQIIRNYDGNAIKLNQELSLNPQEFPKLKKLVGHDLITTDGTTLLGADDKAGIAIIMSMAQYLSNHPEIKHNDIQIAFTPDEEIGRGSDHFDVDRFHSQYAYTIDGDEIDVYNYENFNAYSAQVKIKGKSIHPGSATGKMINASRVAIKFDQLLSEFMRPEYTEKYEGFNHLHHIEGQCEYCQMDYIIRNHDKKILDQQIKQFNRAKDFLNEQYGYHCIDIQFKESYLNMADIVLQHPKIIERLKNAMEKCGIEAQAQPIRGGTDGALLTYKNLPCPNIGTGGGNFHGPFEYVSLTSMKKGVQLLIELVRE